ncbi:agrin [Phymastichus coffea]|uniref:agrin n=1 Tax=Phymastichus coffea TaxID=108790 RepID=UPI00273B310E|nr:agrin [Phymastichus coffea]
MRLTLALGALLLIVVVEAGVTDKPVTTKPAQASQSVKDAIKAAQQNKKDCQRQCPAIYEPICAHDPADTSFKPRTFGNQCVLETHNCEMGTKLVMKNKGACPGSEGVRVS